MKKLKIALLFLILVALFVVVYQNWLFFSAVPEPKVAVDLKILDHQLWGYQAPDIAHGLYFLGCFLVGFLVAYSASLMSKFRASKMAKELNAVIDSQQEKISTLRGEMDLLKRRPVVEAPAAEETAPEGVVEEEAGAQPEMETTSQQS